MEILSPSILKNITLPLYATKISCGFPSPAEDYLEAKLDLNEKLIQRPSSTFLLKAEGDSMTNAGIFNNDLLVVDKSIKPQHGHIIVAVVNGEFTLKRLVFRFPKTILQPENPKFKPLEITAEMNFEVWGVVTHTIHGFLKND
ncbi:MAG: translesion error-prone DNA polymerase V autoproteolytic subunit [Bdellovibrionota bacterium]|mgnify:CR=1 FL=1